MATFLTEVSLDWRLLLEHTHELTSKLECQPPLPLERLVRLSVPVQYGVATRDHLVPLEEEEWVVAYLAQGKLLILEGGHALESIDMDALAGHILRKGLHDVSAPPGRPGRTFAAARGTGRRGRTLEEGNMEDEYTEISNDSAIALVRKVRTRNGVRLEIYAPEQDRRVYLDPLLIESLAWQTPETFSNTLEDPPEATSTKEVEEAQVEAENEYTELTNEFAYTLVRKVRIRSGARLEILSPKLDYQTYLDAPLLESLTWQTTETFSRFLEEPYGPRGTH